MSTSNGMVERSVSALIYKCDICTWECDGANYFISLEVKPIKGFDDFEVNASDMAGTFPDKHICNSCVEAISKVRED